VSTRRSDRSAEERFSISPDRLQVVVRDGFDRTRRDYDWRAPLGILAGLLVAAASSDFSAKNKRLGLDGSQWQIVVLIGIAVCVVWLIVTLVRRSRHAYTAQDFVRAIEEAADLAPVERRALFFCRSAGDDRVLVYEDPIWECLLLPHVNVAGLANIEYQDDPFLMEWVSRSLGLDMGKFAVHYLEGCDLISLKHSEYHEAPTRYEFRFFNVIAFERTAICELSSTVRGRKFFWKTIGDLESSRNWQRNKDVTRHISDNYDAFFVRAKPFGPSGAAT
jgi:hypothetical protein